MNSFCERLKEERKLLGKTQVEVAELCSVTVQSVRYYESGKRKPDSEYLAAFAAAGADVYYILMGHRKDEPQPILLKPHEQELITHYRALNQLDQNFVRQHCLAMVARAVDSNTAVTVRKRKAVKNP